MAEYLYSVTPRGRLESAGIAYTTQAFVEAAGSGNASVVSLFVAAGMDKEGKAVVTVAGNGRERTALHAACAGGHLAVVTYLVNAGASVSSTDGSGGTALHAAVGSGNLEIVKLLVNNGAAVNARDSYSETPLYHAASYGHLAIVRYLVGTAGADITIASHDRLMPYGVAELLGHTAVVSYLRPQTAAVLNDAAKSGDLAAVKSLVAAGMGVDLSASNGYSALYYATYRGHLEVVKYLVGQGAKPSYTALITAAGHGSLEIVKFLVGAGAAVNTPDSSPLHRAAAYGRLAVVRYLVDQGADVNARNRSGKTPRDLAVRGGHTAVVSYFDSL